MGVVSCLSWAEFFKVKIEGGHCKALAKRCSPLEPTRAKFSTSMELAFRLATRMQILIFRGGSSLLEFGVPLGPGLSGEWLGLIQSASCTYLSLCVCLFLFVWMFVCLFACRRFPCHQRVYLYNAFATDLMCRAGLEVIDVFPFTRSYPEGTGGPEVGWFKERDIVHFKYFVMRPINIFLERYFRGEIPLPVSLKQYAFSWLIGPLEQLPRFRKLNGYTSWRHCGVYMARADREWAGR